MKKLIVAAALISAITLSACQGSDPAPEQTDNSEAKVIAAIGQKYLLAQRAGDWQQMCLLLDKKSQQALSGKNPSSKDPLQACTNNLEQSPAKTQQALQASTTGVKIVKSAVNGNKAEILAQTPDGPDTLSLTKKGKYWQISLTS